MKKVLGMMLGLTVAAQAQLLMVTGQYRITEIDQKNQRFGIALLEARPDVTQNWVYLDPNTEIHQRVTNRDGWHKEKMLNYYQFFEEVRPGTLIRVNGGRRWDGEISGKKFWVNYPADEK